MRLFVALEIPDPILRQVSRLMEGLRGELPRARWVRAEGIHLTLVFLGELAEDRLVPLERSLAPVFARWPPLRLAVRGAGTFPEARPARVAWLGVECGPELGALQAELATAMVELAGVEIERRPYHPHLTLARPAVPWPKAAVERFARLADGALGDPFVVERGVLVESRLAPGGARYRLRGSFPLAARGVTP